MAPLYSLMEAEVLKRLREMVGWDDGDGIFAPGKHSPNGSSVTVWAEGNELVTVTGSGSVLEQCMGVRYQCTLSFL